MSPRAETRASGRWQSGLCLACIAVVSMVAGCQSAAQHQLTALSAFDNGDFQASVTALDAAAEERGSEQELIAVDHAIAQMLSGNARYGETELRQARSRLDYLKQKDLKEQTQAVFTDDQAVSWTPRDYERRMIDSLLVLASLQHGGEDSFAYSSQAMETVHQDLQSLQAAESERQDAEQDASEADELIVPNRFSVNALSAYLHAAVNSEQAMNSDLTDRSIRAVSFWHRGSDSSDLLTAGFGTQTGKRHGTVHVITLHGRVTDWQPETAVPTSAALLVAGEILSSTGDHTVPPNVAPVQIARPIHEAFTSRIQTRISWDNGSNLVQQTGHQLVDLNAAAFDSYQQSRDDQIARAVARRIVKKASVYAAKDSLGVGSNSGLDVVINLGGMAWEALEKPDTRHISLLPASVEVVQLEVPVGSQEVHLDPVWNDGALAGERVTVDVEVEDGRNSYVICVCPPQQPDRLIVLP